MGDNLTSAIDLSGDLIIYKGNSFSLLYDKKSRSVLEELHLIAIDESSQWDRYIEAKKRELFFKRALASRNRLVVEIRECLSIIYGKSEKQYYASTSSNVLAIRYEKAQQETLWVLLNAKNH